MSQARSRDTLTIKNNTSNYINCPFCRQVINAQEHTCPLASNAAVTVYEAHSRERAGESPAPTSEPNAPAEAAFTDPELEVWLCPVHRQLDDIRKLKPLDNCVACIRVERDELKSKLPSPELWEAVLELVECGWRSHDLRIYYATVEVDRLLGVEL